MHVAREAAVAFHWLRRERVLEREVFRFGTGTFLTLFFLGVLQGVSIPQKP